MVLRLVLCLLSTNMADSRSRRQEPAEPEKFMIRYTPTGLTI